MAFALAEAPVKELPLKNGYATLEEAYLKLEILMRGGKILNKLKIKGIGHVIYRDWMSFKKLFQISIFPNLFDLILYLVAMGLGLGSFVGQETGCLTVSLLR